MDITLGIVIAIVAAVVGAGAVVFYIANRFLKAFMK